MATSGQAYPCAVTSAAAAALTCTAPAAPAGAYSLRISTALGYADSSPTVSMPPRITAVSPPAGSLAGGLAVTLTATGAPFDAENMENNRVFLAGLPCEVTSVAATSLTCTSPSVVGVVPTVVRPFLLLTAVHRGLPERRVHERWPQFTDDADLACVEDHRGHVWSAARFPSCHNECYEILRAQMLSHVT